MIANLLLVFSSRPGARMKSIWIFRLRATISVVGLSLLTFNVFGFLLGFVYFGLSPQLMTNHRRILVTYNKQFDSLTTRLRGSINRPDSIPSHLDTAPPLFRPNPVRTSNLVSETILPKASATTGGFPRRQRSTAANRPTRGDLRRQTATPCLHRRGRNPQDGVWYDFSIDDTLHFYAYSAFVDDRPSIGSRPVVRIIALSTKLEINDSLSSVGKTLYCAYSYDETETQNSINQTRPLIVKVRDKAGPIGFGLELDGGVKLKEYIFTCPLGRGKRHPVAVRIVESSDLVSAGASCGVPIEVPAKPGAKEDFAVCVQVSYGQPDPHRLIEWLELQRILGVSRIGVYDLSIEPGKGLEVLRQYAREGFVELRKTEALPVPGRLQFLLHGSPVINDCLYRNMHSFRWILVIDFDEVLVSRLHLTLRELAAHLDRTSARSTTAGPANFLFQNQYFFLDSEPDGTESTDYTMIRYRRRAPLSPHGYAMKGYVDPQGCVQMHNHYCMGVTEAFEAMDHYAFVDPSVATSHHYKRCHLSTEDCQKMLAQTTQDDVMMTYKATLKRNVERKTSELLL